MHHAIRSFALIAILLTSEVACTTPTGGHRGEDRVSVLTYNILAGGMRRGQPLSQTAKVIRASGADIVGIQEATNNDSADQLAELLGWNMLRLSRSCVILTRHEIVAPYEYGGKLRLDSGQDIYLFNLHLPPYPYQPYDLLGLGKTHIHTEQQAIASANKTRGQHLATILTQINALPDKNTPVFVTGDFNEPSHLDWTDAAAQAKRHPIKVAYPTSLAMARAGFADVWRTYHPDEMKHPGNTWTPTTKADNPKDHHDRIDFVYFRGKGVVLKNVQVVGENETNADIVVAPYPSDHRAVVASFVLPRAPK